MSRRHVTEAHKPQMYASLRDIISVREAAQRYCYHPRTVRQWCDEGFVAARKDALGRWWISASSVQTFLRESNIERHTTDE
jgi:hypothetical protein